MLGQTVIYTLSTADDALFGQLGQRSYAAIVSRVHADGKVNLHLLMEKPSPVVVRCYVEAGTTGQPGRWAPVTA